jgi:exopolysaccharide production protein ExoZ
VSPHAKGRAISNQLSSAHQQTGEFGLQAGEYGLAQQLAQRFEHIAELDFQQRRTSGDQSLMKSERNDAIQGLRGIAALLVVAAHSILNLIQRANYDPQAAQLAFRLGELGVKTFFMISGFIMTVTMYDAFGRRGAPTSFLLKRLMRIVPLYWLATALYSLRLVLQGTPPRWDDLLLSLLFIPYDHGQPFGEPVYGLGWTLNYEMFFYYLFALSLLLRRRYGLALLLISFALLMRLGDTSLGRHAPGAIHAVFYTLTGPIIMYFAAGVILGATQQWLARRHRSPRISVNFAIGVSILGALSYAILISHGIGLEDHPISGSFVQICFCVIPTSICALASSDDSGRWIRALFLAVGNASYSIYLTHSFIMGYFAKLWVDLMGTHPSPSAAVSFIALMIVATSILGYLSFRLIERPSLDFLRRRVTHDRQIVA